MLRSCQLPLDTGQTQVVNAAEGTRVRKQAFRSGLGISPLSVCSRITTGKAVQQGGQEVEMDSQAHNTLGQPNTRQAMYRIWRCQHPSRGAPHKLHLEGSLQSLCVGARNGTKENPDAGSLPPLAATDGVRGQPVLWESKRHESIQFLLGQQPSG